MKKLIIPVEKLNPILDSFEVKGVSRLSLMHILAIIWSYRKTDKGMYYTNDQLAELLGGISPRTVKGLMKMIRDKKLVVSTRRYNSSTTYKPSAKFEALMGSKEKGHHDLSLKEKGTTRPTGRASDAHYTSSKEEEDRNIPQDVLRLFRAEPSWKKRHEAYVDGYGLERANQYALTYIKNKKEKV